MPGFMPGFMAPRPYQLPTIRFPPAAGSLLGTNSNTGFMAPRPYQQPTLPPGAGGWLGTNSNFPITTGLLGGLAPALQSTSGQFGIAPASTPSSVSMGLARPYLLSPRGPGPPPGAGGRPGTPTGGSLGTAPPGIPNFSAMALRMAGNPVAGPRAPVPVPNAAMGAPSGPRGSSGGGGGDPLGLLYGFGSSGGGGGDPLGLLYGFGRSGGSATGGPGSLWNVWNAFGPYPTG